MKPVFFATATAFRNWLARHHATAAELVIGFYKKHSGKGGLTYPEAVDELLCFGWIDGIVRSLDDERYTHRATPRRRDSIWSRVNVRHVARLARAGKMHPAGMKAFNARIVRKTGIYRYENPSADRRRQEFPAAYESKFRANRRAWEFWQAQPPGYRRLAIRWVISAKREDTRRRRLEELVALNARKRRLGAK